MDDSILLDIRQDHAAWTKIINCYIIPIVTVIVVITSVLVIKIYVKEYKTTINEIRRVASLVYAAIAVANILTVVPKAIFYFYAFTYGNISHYIPFDLCWAWFFINQLATIPHTASIWLVAILCLQRYIVIKCTFTASQKCTVSRTVVTIIIIWIVSIALQMPSFFGCKFEPYDITCQTRPYTNESCTTCLVYFAEWLEGHGVTIGIINLVLKSGVVLIPTSFIVVYCNISLLLYMRKIAKVHKVLTEAPEIAIHNVLGNRTMNKIQKHHEEKPHILIIVALSFIFVIVDIPYIVLIGLKIHYISISSYESIEWFWIGPTRNVADLTVVCSYPSLFVLSCMLSYRFRYLLRRLILKRPKRHFRRAVKHYSRDENS